MRFERLERRSLLTTSFGITLPEGVEAAWSENGHMYAIRDFSGDGLADIIVHGAQPLSDQEALANPGLKAKQWLGLIASESIVARSPEITELPLPSDLTASVSNVTSGGEGWLRAESLQSEPRFIRGRLDQLHLLDAASLPSNGPTDEIFAEEFLADFDGDGVLDRISDLTVIISDWQLGIQSSERIRVSNAFPIGDFDGDGADDFVVEERERFDPGFGYWWAQVGAFIQSRNGTIPFDRGARFVTPHIDKGAHNLDELTPAPEEWGPGFFMTYRSDGVGNAVYVFVGAEETIEVDFDPREEFGPRSAEIQAVDFNGDGIEDQVRYSGDNPDWVQITPGINVEIALGRNTAPTICGDGQMKGDANGDGEVNMTDFLIFSSNFGREASVSFADGDFDCDGEIGFSDFLSISRNFGRSLA